MIDNTPEPFVDAEKASAFLHVTPRYLIARARAGELPAHPLGSGPRKQWRFRLTELSRALEQPTRDNSRGSLPR